MAEFQSNLLDDKKVLAKGKLLFSEPNEIMYSAKLGFFTKPNKCGGSYSLAVAYTGKELLEKLSSFKPDIVVTDISQFSLDENLLSDIKSSVYAPKDIITWGDASWWDEKIGLDKTKFVKGNFDPITTAVKPESMYKLGMLVRKTAIEHGLYERTDAESWQPFEPHKEIKFPSRPSPEELPKRLIEIIAEQLAVKQQEVTPQASFVDDLGADSLDTVELVMALEEEFGIEIPDGDAERMTTVGDAIKYIKEKLQRSYE